MKNLITLFGIALSINCSFSQCETKTTELDDGQKVISMTEKFYQNEDLENGAKTFYVSANNFILGQDKSIFDLVITYVSVRNNYWIIPNTLKIGLDSGVEIVLQSKEKSSQTLNRTTRLPNTMKGVECYFQINYDDIVRILSSESISHLVIEDYKTGADFDITPKYRGQLNEMMKCVLKL
ncbi:MAG: hypothetical protein ACSHXG_16040 [Maribacter stanieri]